MMSQSPDDDRELVSFLKEYRPLPPPGNQNLEIQLLEKVAQESSPYRQKVPVGWVLSLTLAASLGAVVAGSRWSQPSYQLANSSTDLEAFMVNTWQGTTNDSSVEFLASPVDSEWLLLGNSQNQYVVSNP